MAKLKNHLDLVIIKIGFSVNYTNYFNWVNCIDSLKATRAHMTQAMTSLYSDFRMSTKPKPSELMP